ncbi:MAG: hypothetical protein IJU20_00730 [Clostridia bacterium]|nr:hypothetical protein [Clostridia bacterium]
MVSTEAKQTETVIETEPVVQTETETQSETDGARFVLDLSKNLSARGDRIAEFVCPESGYVTAQGCCFDGECWVVAFNRFDQNGEECTLLCKYDPEGKLVGTSDGPLYLEHANNISYLPEEEAYYVTSCQGTIRECWDGYSIVDKDTLEVLEKGTLDAPFFAMAYCPERQAYASGRWSGEILDFWDRQRHITLTRDVKVSGTLSQGVFATQDYVFFVRSSRTLPVNGVDVYFHQELRVYDWNGDWLTDIPLELQGDAESESVNIVDGEMYVTSNQGGSALLYRVVFTESE